MEARKFTFFAKFGEALEGLSDADKDTILLAIVKYGTYGEDPTFGNAYLKAIFEAFREDIDNSVRSCNANGGGRPRKPKGEPPTPMNGTGYPIECMQVFNEVAVEHGRNESTYLSGSVQNYLAGMAGQVPISEVKRMCEFKFSEWATDKKMKNQLTPGVLFAPEHFLQYIDQAKAAGGVTDGFIKQPG